MQSLPVMGCDPHLDTVAVSVMDPLGGEIARAEWRNHLEGWEGVLEWCRRYRVEKVGIEGASGYGRCLAQTLSAAGRPVIEIPTRFTARTRRIDGAGKSDPGDARTIARAVLAGEGHLWVDQPEAESLRLLFNRRQHLVSLQTQEINQLRALLAEIDPAQAAGLGRLRSKRSFGRLCLPAPDGDRHRETAITLIRQLAQDCITRLGEIRRLEAEIGKVLPPPGVALVNRIHGCGVIVAAGLLTQLAGTDDFESEARFAAWAGIAPLDASSGRQLRHRLNRGGNRQVNRAIHTIVITQVQQRGEAYHYLLRRTKEGKTKKEAIRTAKRHVARRVWRILHAELT